MKRIEIQTSAELNLLLEALKNEIINANSYHRLFCGLITAGPDYEREFSQSNVFWYLTLEALQNARQISLCRVYDQESNSLNLVNLLHIIKANLHLFSKENFRKRLEGNVFVDSLVEASRTPQVTELDCDIESVSCQNSMVKKLMIWRNNIVAHRGAAISLGKSQILTSNPLSKEDIEKLLEHSLGIFNKYSSLYNASTHSTGLLILGQDDYKDLLKFIRLGLKKWDEDTSKPFDIADLVKPQVNKY